MSRRWRASRDPERRAGRPASLLALLLLLAPGCAPRAVEVFTLESLPLSRPVDAGSFSGFLEPERAVVRDSVQFGELWRRAHAHLVPVPPLPSIDFERNMVIVAALGKRSTGGYAVAIRDVDATSGRVIVSVDVTTPGERCMVTMAESSPFDLVVVPVRSGTVEFHERTRRDDCR
jgi:hypothetical protein